jgi:hypothetical protein
MSIFILFLLSSRHIISSKMTRVNKMKSPAKCRRASDRYRELRSQRVYQGKTGGPKNSPRSGRVEYTDRMLTRVYPELRIYATCAVSWCGV